MSRFRLSFLDSLPPVSRNLIIVNAILWLASLVTPAAFMRFGLEVDLTDILGMHYWQSAKFNPAQMVTYAFMHGGLGHIFFNMFALYMFGGILEHVWGPKRFLLYYLVTAVGAGLVQQLFWYYDFNSVVTVLNEAIDANSGQVLLSHADSVGKFFKLDSIAAFTASDLLELKKMFLDLPVTIGASGAVFGLLLAFGWLFPEQELFLMFIPIPIKARVFVILYGALELFLGVAKTSNDNVAHFAHLGGMLFGALLIIYWRRRRTY